MPNEPRRTAANYSERLKKMKKHQAEVLLYTIEEAAQAMGVSRTTAYKMAGVGELPVIEIRGGLRVPVESLKDLIARKLHDGGTE